MSRPPARAAALAAVLALTAGCGPAPTGSVSGTVTVAGQPVPNGLITFSSEVGKRDSFSAAILNGKYTTEPMPVGVAKITIINRGANPAEVPAKETGGGDLLPVARPTAKAEVKVPLRYSAVDSSGLNYDVPKGDSTKDFDLTP